LFNDIFTQEPIDPVGSARRGLRPGLRARFYKEAQVGEAAEGFAILLDGKTVRTPARRALAAPSREIAEALGAEWQAQRETIDPAAMPVTRLANAIIDRVAEAPTPVRAEIERYLGSDLLCYRTTAPEGLVARQAANWDPLLAWAEATYGARFALAAGVMHVPQPVEAVAAAATALPSADGGVSAIWRLGALSVVTTLTGSALLALALHAGRLDAEAVWSAAHVDEDWNMETWGRDTAALDRRAFHFAELKAAATVLAVLR
jgi:chaperone required for assembly of F1-ATPase